MTPATSTSADAVRAASGGALRAAGWLALAAALACVAPGRAGADAFDDALQDERENQQIHAVLGPLGVRALNQKETQEMRERLLGSLTQFREEGEEEEEHGVTLYTTGYYDPVGEEVEINREYYDMQVERWGEADAAILMKMTLAHEDQHCVDDSLDLGVVEGEQSARKTECLLYYQVREKIQSARLRDRLDRECAKIVDRAGELQPTSEEVIQQLCYKERRVERAPDHGRIELRLPHMGVRFGYHAAWQAFAEEGPTPASFVLRLAAPRIEGSTAPVTITLLVEPTSANGGRFAQPGALAGAITAGWIYEAIEAAPSEPALAGFDVDVRYALSGARPAPLMNDEFSRARKIRALEDAAATAVDESRRLLVTARQGLLVALVLDARSDDSAGREAGEAELEAIAASLEAIAREADAPEMEIAADRLGVAFPVPRGWSIGPVTLRETRASLRAAGPVGPGFSQPSVTVLRSPGVGDRDLDAVVSELMSESEGVLLYRRPSRMLGREAVEYRTLLVLSGPGHAPAGATVDAPLVLRSAVAIEGDDAIQLRVVHHLRRERPGAELFRRARTAIRLLP